MTEKQNNILKISNICKHYNLFQIENLSFALKEGSITGLIGENGAGKSTILKIIAGIIGYEEGEIFFREKKRKNKESHLGIGYLSDGQEIYPDIPLKQISQFVRKVYGKRWNNKKYEYYLKEVFKVDERKKMKELSTGMRVKYFLALELARQPKLLLLDEPTSGLDPIIREEVLQILENLCKTEKVTILFSSHITEDIEKIGERVIYIDNGVILLNEEKEKIKSEYIKIPKAAYQGVEKKAVALRDYYLIENSQVTLPDTIQKEPAMLSEVLYFLKEKTNVSSDIKRF